MAGTDLVLSQEDPPERHAQLVARSAVSPTVQHIQASQERNQVTGDMAAGNIDKSVTNVFGVPQFTAMTRVIRELAREQQENLHLSSIIANLEHFMNRTTDGDVRGLQEKLEAADRADQLQIALLRKQTATQFILKHQGSPAAQKILSFLLGKLQSAFENQVTPLIIGGAARADIDAAIQQHVLDSAWAFLEENPLDIDYPILTGLLYFLGGNCHLRWDSC